MREDFSDRDPLGRHYFIIIIIIARGRLFRRVFLVIPALIELKIKADTFVAQQTCSKAIWKPKYSSPFKCFTCCSALMCGSELPTVMQSVAPALHNLICKHCDG